MERVEVFSTFADEDVVFRAKIQGIQRALSGRFSFDQLTQNTACRAVLLRLHLDRPLNPEFLNILREKARQTCFHLFVPDFEPRHLPGLMVLKDFIQVYLVSTPELQTLLQFKVPGVVECLPDPIELWQSKPQSRVHQGPGSSMPLRLAWFGYPDSYAKSMHVLEPVFTELAAQGLATLSVFTATTQEKKLPFGYLRRYDAQTIFDNLDQHDAVVLSHLAMDFSVNTHCKSENKAVLAIHHGLPVVASQTPAYTRFLSQYGLENFLFNNRKTLIEAVEKLRDPEVRNDFLQRSQSRTAATYNQAEIARQWVDILERKPFIMNLD